MSSMTSPSHEAALRFLYGRIDYERAAGIPYHAAGLKLDRMRELLARLGDPHSSLPIAHVAGTKGKGSTASMLASVLSAAGYRPGLFSSPHLHRIEERFAVDGRPAAAQEVVELVEIVRPHVEAMDRRAAGDCGPTFFDITTAMALLHFRRQQADVAVLEVGMGGRLDSTNVCTPCVSVITSISLDHTRQLGNTLAAIAGEKAGIVKPGVPVVSGVVPEEPAAVIRAKSRECGSLLLELERDFTVDYHPPRHLNREPSHARIDFRALHPRIACQYHGVEIGSPGAHQAANAAIALAALAELSAQGWRIPPSAVRRGLASVRCPARVEVVSRWPTVIRDAAHNVASIDALLATLNESFDACRRILVFATTQEKDYENMLARLLPAFDEVILTRYNSNPRGVAVCDLESAARRLGYAVRCVPAPQDAWQLARALSRPADLVCVTGSFYLAGELWPDTYPQERFDPAATERNIA